MIFTCLMLHRIVIAEPATLSEKVMIHQIEAGMVLTFGMILKDLIAAYLRRKWPREGGGQCSN